MGDVIILWVRIDVTACVRMGLCQVTGAAVRMSMNVFKALADRDRDAPICQGHTLVNAEREFLNLLKINRTL